VLLKLGTTGHQDFTDNRKHYNLNHTRASMAMNIWTSKFQIYL
jgi:hypothetical protein